MLFLTVGNGFAVVTKVCVGWVGVCDGAIVVTMRCCPATETMLFCDTTANWATWLPALLAIWIRFGWPGLPVTRSVVPGNEHYYCKNEIVNVSWSI